MDCCQKFLPVKKSKIASIEVSFIKLKFCQTNVETSDSPTASQYSKNETCEQVSEFSSPTCSKICSTPPSRVLYFYNVIVSRMLVMIKSFTYIVSTESDGWPIKEKAIINFCRYLKMNLIKSRTFINRFYTIVEKHFRFK